MGTARAVAAPSVLVGHSYGGLVSLRAACIGADTIAGVMSVEGFLSTNGGMAIRPTKRSWAEQLHEAMQEWPWQLTEDVDDEVEAYAATLAFDDEYLRLVR